MPIAKIGDLHIGSRQGSQYVRDFIKNYLINYFIPELKENGITKVVSFGDMFDVRKFMYGRDKDWLSEELVPALRDAGITWDGIIGNHDITLADSNRINWPSTLQDMAPDVFTFFSEPTEVEYDGVKVLMMPWINKENYNQAVKAIEDSTAQFMFAHLELAGFKMYQSSVCDHGQIDVSLLSKFHRVDTGHFHTRSYDSNINYLGSPYHLTWEDHKDGDNRGFYIDDLTIGGDVFVKNNATQTLFRVLSYDYSSIPREELDSWHDVEWLNKTLGIEGQVVKVVVKNRDNAKHYQAFCDVLKRCACIDYNFIDTTTTISTEHIEVTEEMMTVDAVEVLKKDITQAENIQRKDSVCKLAEHYFTKAQNRISVES